MDNLETNIICHIAVVTKDIEKMAGNYAQIFGFKEPNIISVDSAVAQPEYFRGRPIKADHKMAYFKMGLIQLELIEPTAEPSVWREFLDKHGEGIHHIAFYVKDLNQTAEFFETKGMPVIQKGGENGKGYNYIDATGKLGLVLEILEKNK